MSQQPAAAAERLFDRSLLAGLFLFLVAVDLVLTALHLALLAHGRVPRLWSITRDGSVPEFWQYAKWLVLAGLTTWVFVIARRPAYLVLAAFFLYFLADDSLSLHERVGVWITRLFGFAPHLGLRAVDFGELSATATAALLLFGALFFAYRFTSDETTRRFVRTSVALILVLALFGVGVDMADIVLDSAALSIVEDAGEMVAASALVAAATAHLAALRRLPAQTDGIAAEVLPVSPAGPRASS